VTVSDTRADGIHMTGGARDGIVRRPVVTRSGDDAVAVVSYQGDRDMTQRISVLSPRVHGTTGGRGVSVVGGRDILYRDVSVQSSSGAGVYIATEGAPFFTRSVERVRVLGAQLVEANTDASIDHGAVLVAAAAEGMHVRDVTLTDLRVRNTRTGASRQVGVLAYTGALSDVAITDVAVWGGGRLFGSTAGPSSVRTSGWTVDGHAIGDPQESS
jgi:hypothetical protein